MNVIQDLAELIARGRLALFMGSDLPSKLTGLPSRVDLAAKLSQRLNIVGPLPPWPDVATQYEATAGLNALITWLWDQVESVKLQPGPIYHLLAQLPVNTFVTTTYDNYLYSFLQESSRNPNVPVVDSSSLGLLDMDRPTVVKLYGTYDHPGSLVLTSEQIRSLPQTKSQLLSGLVHPTLANKSVLILGQELRDQFFLNFYQNALFQAGTIRPSAYAIWHDVAEWEKQTWLGQDVRVIETPVMEFIDELVQMTKPAVRKTERARWQMHSVATKASSPPSDTTMNSVKKERPPAIVRSDIAVKRSASGRHHLTWLHLSDLHFSLAKQHQDGSLPYDANVVLHALLQDITERIQEDHLQPDFVVVTGDIAFSGQSREYVLAQEFFDDLLRVTELEKERLFLVPGNHDVDRGWISRGAIGISESLTDRKSVNEVLADADDRRLVFARFNNYAAFINNYLGGHLFFSDESYYYVQVFGVLSYKIALLGLNSAWLARGGGQDHGNLVIGECQTRAALQLAKETDIKIALLHHPFDWLREFDQDDSKSMLSDGCDFVLHGHMHKADLLQVRGPDTDACIIAAGACYETREYPNSYNLVRLDLKTGRGTIFLRMYSDKRGGFWTKDVVNYRNVSDGKYSFSFRTKSIQQ